MDMFVSLFSITSRDSFKMPESWQPELLKYSPGTPIILVGEKLRAECPPTAPVTHRMGCAMAKLIGAHEYLEVDPLTQDGLKHVFDEASRIAMDPPPKAETPKGPVAFLMSKLSSPSQRGSSSDNIPDIGAEEAAEMAA